MQYVRDVVYKTQGGAPGEEAGDGLLDGGR